MNLHNRYAVAVKINILSNVLRELSKCIYHFIINDGSVTYEVCGKLKRSSLAGKGLEILCIYKCSSDKKPLCATVCGGIISKYIGVSSILIIRSSGYSCQVLNT